MQQNTPKLTAYNNSSLLFLMILCVGLVVLPLVLPGLTPTPELEDTSSGKVIDGSLTHLTAHGGCPLCCPHVALVSSSLDVWGTLREASQESESRSCRASSGLAVETTQGHCCRV